jgi:ATP-dependent helicase HepA
MSGMEIVLEGIQDELMVALKNNPRHGLAQLVDDMVIRAEKLRDEVEEERYFEELAINEKRREEFTSLSEKHRDGKLLRKACLQWAHLTGLYAEYHPHSDTVIFHPKRFSTSSMKKARFDQPPNMEEALRRSGRRNNLVIRGTFNRDVAVRHEELIFFAPGNDPWLDAIIANAIEADRGRCCAIHRQVSELIGSWRGFEVLYSLMIDPRPLYQLGHDPTHLFRAFGFLQTSTYRLLISEQGQRMAVSSTEWKSTKKPFSKRDGDIHLGKRDGTSSHIQEFKMHYPPEEWQIIIQRVFTAAEDFLAEELDDYMAEIAIEAQTIFAKQVAGLRTIQIWQSQYPELASSLTDEKISKYEHISDALVMGIQRPVRRLESVCYWSLEGGK